MTEKCRYGIEESKKECLWCRTERKMEGDTEGEGMRERERYRGRDTEGEKAKQRERERE